MRKLIFFGLFKIINSFITDVKLLFFSFFFIIEKKMKIKPKFIK
jgi:hypothetical protein